MRPSAPSTDLPVSHRTSVKRVVMTSSSAAVLEFRDKPMVYTEKDWNEQSWKVVEEKGRDAPAMQKYRASKNLAEKGMHLMKKKDEADESLSIAAWKLWESHKNTIEWDLVSINPPFVSLSSRQLQIRILTYLAVCRSTG